MLPRKLLLLVVILAWATGSQGLLAEEIDDLCEYETPKLLAEYWPVFPKDPHERRKGVFPHVDVIVDKDGNCLNTAPVGIAFKDEVEALGLAGAMLSYEPAYACGEVVEGFDRHQILNYFYVEEEDREQLSELPKTNFLIPREVLTYIDYLGSLLEEDQLILSVDVDATGRITRFKGRIEEARVIIDMILKPTLPEIAFQPALKDGVPVPVRLKLRLQTGIHADTRPTGIKVDRTFKPMPICPEPGTFEPGRPHTVMLSFDKEGVMNNVQFLSEMNQAEAMSALMAFRQWRIELKASENPGATRIIVQYAFSEESEVAELLEESHGEHLTRPKPLKLKRIKYPRKQAYAGTRGLVVVVFIVDKEGKIRAPKIEFSSDEAFSDSVLKALIHWTFEPALLDGKPINVRVRQHFPFG